jgi:transposase
LAWLFFRLPPLLGLAFERRASLPGLAVAWLKRGVSAAKVLELGVPATVLARRNGRSVSMAAVMIGVDPHKASHTAVAISAAEEPLGELRVRACAVQAERLLAWAAAWPQRTWAVEGAGGLGHLLAQQLLSAGERVLDVPPKLGARVRLLAAGDTNKNDPNDARSVAVAALRSAGVREVRPDDHAAVLKIWSKRYRDLGRSRTQVACRLHAVLCELTPGGVSKAITAPAAVRLLESITPAGAVEAARCELAAAFAEDLRGIDARIRETRKKLAVAVQAAGTSLTGLYGVGPVVAAVVIGDVRDVSRFPGRDHFAAYNGTAPIEVSSGPRKIYRLSRRGNRRLNHAIHMVAVTQIGHRHSEGHAYYDKKLAEGKTPKEALRSLKRQVSNAIFACLQADARRAATRAAGPGGQQGNDSATSAAGLHPRHRLFGQATPGPGHHTTTAASNPAPGPARTRGRAGHSSIAATLPPAQPQVQVERPQRSEDERPGGAARRRPHSAARKARGQGSLRKPQRPKGTSQAAKNTDRAS